MRHLAATLFVAAAAILLSPAECWAQGRTTGSQASAFGSGSSLGASRFGQSGFGTSSLGGSLGGSSLGQSSFGGGQAGGLGGQSSFGSNTTGGATNQGFVGRTGSDLEAFFGGVGQAFQSIQRSQRVGRGSASAPDVRRPEVRVRLTPSTELRRATLGSQSTAEAAVANVSRLLARRDLNGVFLSTAAGVVTLEGVVATESERLLAEKLASIEPGVRAVENRLRIDAEPQEIVPAPR